MQTNIESSGTTMHTWGLENRLEGVQLPGTGGTLAFKHVPLGSISLIESGI
jgi:hypothetical protein